MPVEEEPPLKEESTPIASETSLAPVSQLYQRFKQIDNELQVTETDDIGTSTSKVELEEVLPAKMDHEPSVINESAKFNNSPRQEVEKQAEKSTSPKLSRIASINKSIKE